MNDEQLVLALIASYKARGIDLSSILDDPLFSKLPAWSKIKAIQDHAQELHDGVHGGMTRGDWKRVGVNSLFSGITGGLAGATAAAGLQSAGHLGGVTLGEGRGYGALIGGLAGAMLGGLGAYSHVADRREIKQSLGIAATNPTAANAIGALSTSHMNAGSRDLRSEILSRIADEITNASKEEIPSAVKRIHNDQLAHLAS
jgi:hypothetical protein